MVMSKDNWNFIHSLPKLVVCVYMYTDILKDIQIVHTSLCNAITYFKIHIKYYIIIY